MSKLSLFFVVLALASATAASAQHAEISGLQLQELEQRPGFTSFESHLEALLTREDERPANVLIKYLVPPPVQKEFIQVFKEVKDETVKEEGNEDYYLLKPITDNISYYIFGRWESAEAYADHLKSDHTKKLLEFDYKKGVVFTIQPLLIVD